MIQPFLAASMTGFSLLRRPSYLAGQVSKVAQQRLSAALERHDLRLPHLAVLAALHDLGPLSQQELSDALAIDKSHTVSLVDFLAARTLLTRERHPLDRRRHRVTLGRQGRALVPQLLKEVDRSQDAVFGVLTRAERSELIRLLRRVLDAQQPERLRAAPSPMTRRAGAV